MEKDIIQEWAKRINWESRIKAVCKPCWELKYCPYGPLVEQFPLTEERSQISCRIFGHNCPIFYVAEPLTETKELRKVSRFIPRDIQFKVLKRDNQICQICKRNVIDNEIEFDHIIPFSKGGPTEVHNIRLLCKECNRKRKAEFEDEYLVDNFAELVTEPVDIGFIKLLKDTIRFYHQFTKEHKANPTQKDYDEIYGDEKEEDEIGSWIFDIISKLISLLTNKNVDLFDEYFESLRV
jgi:hypothetical protein